MNETHPLAPSEEVVTLSIRGGLEKDRRRFTETVVLEGEESFDFLSLEGLEEVRALIKEAFAAQEQVRDTYTDLDFHMLEDVYLRLEEYIHFQIAFIAKGNVVAAEEQQTVLQEEIKNFIELLELHSDELETVTVPEIVESLDEIEVAPQNLETQIAVFVDRYEGGFAQFEKDFEEFVSRVDPSGVRDTRSSFFALAALTIHDVREMTSPWNEADKDDFLSLHHVTHEDVEPWFTALSIWREIIADIEETEERFDTVARIAFIEHLKQAV